MQRASLLLFIFISFFSCQNEKELRSDSIHAIPIDAAVIVATENLSKSLTSLAENKIWKLLAEQTSIKNNVNTLTQLDSNLTAYASQLTSANPVFISLHSTGATSFNWLAISSTEKQESKFQLLEIGIKSFATTHEHPYSGAIITEVILEQQTLYYTIFRGLIITSQQKILVEDAIRQLKTENNLTQNKAFTSIYNSSNKKEDFNLYISSKNFDKISTSLLQEHSQLNEQAEWFQWDVDVLKKGLLFSGISLSFDSLAQSLNHFKENEGHSLLTPSVLPKNTAIFSSKCFENYKQYKRNFIDGLAHKHQKTTYDKKLLSFKKEQLELFEEWIDSEVTWFLAENSNSLTSGIIIHITNSYDVEHYLNLNADSLIDYREELIVKWDSLDAFNHIFNFNISGKLSYGALLNEQLILCENLALLKTIINDFKAKKSLNNSSDYKDCINELNSSSNQFVYIQNPSALKLSTNYLSSNINKYVNTYAGELSAIKSLALQFNINNNICYSNAYLHLNDTQIDQTRTIWAMQLEAPILSEVSLVKNHYNQQWEIAVQDKNLNLYLISTEGEILWKRQLSEAIIGSIEQIDLFKNKKLQLLFNTASELHLIDRKGRNVRNFPVQLKQKTELPLALFDYENSRNYRILLSCGKHHYMYDKNGKQIKGWKLNRTKSPAIHAAQHFVVAGKDYILLPEENGTLNILNRRGEARIKVKDQLNFSSNKLQVIHGNSLAETRIVTIDKDGIQQNILFNGTIDNSLQFEFDKEIQYSYQFNHHIVLEGENLTVNGDAMNLLYSFDNTELSEVKFYKTQSQHLLTITDVENSQSYLFRTPNDLVEGFPLYGKTSAHVKDIDLDEKLNFIVGGESGIIYNYAAE